METARVREKMKNRDVGSKKGLYFTELLPRAGVHFWTLLKLFFPSDTQPFSSKFPSLKIFVVFTETHYRCTSNPTYTKLVRPDSGISWKLYIICILKIAMHLPHKQLQFGV